MISPHPSHLIHKPSIRDLRWSAGSFGAGTRWYQAILRAGSSRGGTPTPPGRQPPPRSFGDTYATRLDGLDEAGSFSSFGDTYETRVDGLDEARSFVRVPETHVFCPRFSSC